MTILCAYIPGPLGEQTLQAALDQARMSHQDLVVLNTTRAEAAVDDRYLGDSDVAALKARLADSSVKTTVESSLTEARPAESILECARRHSASLIVIGVRHRTPVGKLLMGSTAQAVILGSHCSVLAVKAS